jgi:predicted GNAT family acetyltransferase
MIPEEISVQVEQKAHRGAFFVEREGQRLAELTFSATPDGKLVILDHTEVSDSLRGQGIARKLVEAAVAWARRTNVKLMPLCPFAKAVFDREPEFGDVRA